MIVIRKISNNATTTIDEKGLAAMEYAGLIGGKNPQYVVIEEKKDNANELQPPQPIAKEFYKEVEERIITNENDMDIQTDAEDLLP